MLSYPEYLSFTIIIVLPTARSILSYNVTSRPMGHPALWATFSTTSNFKHLHHHYELSGA